MKVQNPNHFRHACLFALASHLGVREYSGLTVQKVTVHFNTVQTKYGNQNPEQYRRRCHQN